jgi:hypothetical protein
MSCPHHDAAHVCSRCPERYDTDGQGFVHRHDCKGRVALRECRSCKQLKTKPEWSLIDWFRCAECTGEKGEPSGKAGGL